MVTILRKLVVGMESLMNINNGEQSLGTLYLVPTPIGNLEDMTLRGLKVLQEVDYVGAEDTRHSGLLLKHFGISANLISYHEHNKKEKGPYIISLLMKGLSVALVSDAGMPAISDPGADLVSLAITEGVPVVPLPGPNAGLTALIASGLNTTEFTFIGFLPKRKSYREETLKRLEPYEGTLIFYEAPHRIEEVVGELYTYLGNRPIAVGREITKRFETFTRTTLEALTDGTETLTIKGEFVLIVGGKTTALEAMAETESISVEEAVQRKMNSGTSKKEAIREIAKERGMARRDVYNQVIRAQGKDE